MKQALRKSIAKTLETINKSEVEVQSKHITNALKPLIKPSYSVACFMSMDHGEVNTFEILQYLFSQGNNVYLPRCTHTRKTRHVTLRGKQERHHPHLTFHKMQNLEQVCSLKPSGKYKLREPPEEGPAPLPAKLDIILVPGVAFNVKDGARLGWGAGYYDDFFRRYQLHHRSDTPLLVGLALNQQVVDHIPLEPHDYVMDCIASGDGKLHWIHEDKLNK
ncbi:hypothetical protein KAFR_0B07020 [Kazachstania africana CBS 2517]|uniref:5-formyltetrahydrofolate cyclo-ligase n=1 Tax=Kazachstania africana (strain ATCC 22294 / BCRC 22015 / CBS 2517 / CECT 1963 / NBRC 1671 / NRRL Y-8276) TaxID=1071382 RepID=H2ARK0_KAZAF|nr:hypothetical protein KAFR_0B07020 [Kazachstania africana CBS 2517]CCF57000.1 hypothetical protein KAFR_0B07020 [Kazachstania africana CBS 2517]